MENDVLYNRIMNVVHGEYGSGSTAVANPEGEATDSLEKIQIGDDIYSVGGVGAVMVITPSQDPEIGDCVLDKNYMEIETAVEAGACIILINVYESADYEGNFYVDFMPLSAYGFDGNYYYVKFLNLADPINPWIFVSETENGILKEDVPIVPDGGES